VDRCDDVIVVFTVMPITITDNKMSFYSVESHVSLCRNHHGKANHREVFCISQLLRVSASVNLNKFVTQ